MGMALTRCTVPAAGKPTFELGDDEMEIGIGIHGEPGRERQKLERRRDRRDAAGPDPRRPAVHVGRPRARVRQRHGRHAAHRALRRLRQGRRMLLAERGHRRSSATSSAATSPRSRWPAARSRLLKLDDEMIRLWDAPVHTAGAALGRLSGEHRSRAGERRRDGSARFAAAAARRRTRRADRARLGDRRRRPRHQHGPRHAAVVAKLDAGPAGRRSRPLLKRVGMTLISTVGGAGGPALRDALPAARHGVRRRRHGHARGTGRRASTRASRACRPAARPSSATRRWSTPCCRPSTPRRGARRRSGLRRGARPRPPTRRPTGASATIPLVARKGRASYLGERSAGHQDPGRHLQRDPARVAARRGAWALTQSSTRKEGAIDGASTSARSTRARPAPAA